jgi:hypothetical protein
VLAAGAAVRIADTIRLAADELGAARGARVSACRRVGAAADAAVGREAVPPWGAVPAIKSDVVAPPHDTDTPKSR